ncbi:hypothetical protein O181_030293 [Austropuccinia psidii MF-1]|uniref:Uncharacterized protein n=1 Tax=Austropuccinia psidii MF-1 TaxID=1389203 RepID=A0A9Q3CVA2_9BASI|nr:hypothetical protein [Austropuccinia psidii MF-1]
MPSTRSAESYDPSESSQKGYRHYYGRIQSVSEGKGSVNEAQTDKLCHPEADNTVLPSNRAETTTRSLSKHFKSQKKILQECTSEQRIVNTSRTLEKLHESYLTVRKLLGHPDTYKLLNGWHPFVEKNNMILLTEEGRKNNPPPPKQVPKPSLSVQKQQLKCENTATHSEKWQGKSTSHKNIQKRLHKTKD